MKIKITSIIMSSFILSFAVFSFALAENDRVNLGVSANIQGNSTSTEVRNDNASAIYRGNSTSTVARERDNENSETTANENDRGELTSESHRSAVAVFVQSLLSVADREDGIGPEVREIARAQNDSASTTTIAMSKVENRGSFRTFLFGSDYANLGVMRSQIATTTNNINRLKTLLEQTTNEQDRTELTVQIQALEIEQARISAFIKTNESKFSLFGWFNKLMTR